MRFNSEVLNEDYPEDCEYTLDNAPLCDLVLNFGYERAHELYEEIHDFDDDEIDEMDF